MGLSEIRNDAGAGGETRLGAIAAAGAFLFWGVFPLYWKLLHQAPPLEILSHRMIWGCAFMLPLVVLNGRFGEVKVAFRGINFLLLFSTAALLAANGLIFIWAVNNGRVLETSLGNFINPLCNMLFGVVIFRDRPRPLQRLAVIFAVIGVAFMVFRQGAVPWVALGLAGTFSLYGVLRKIVRVESLPGLLVENALSCPFALAVLYWLWGSGGAVFGPENFDLSLLLIGGGVLPIVPMLCFTYGARHLKMTTLGLLHYLLPTASFLLGVFVFHEPFTMVHFITFSFIWVAVGLYMADTLRVYRVR